VDEGDAETVLADFPVHGVADGLEVCEQGYVAVEGGEFAEGDGVEARVFEGGGQGIAPQSVIQLLSLKCADTATQ